MPEYLPQVKQLVQRSEQVFDPIQVPVQVGQDIYIIVQQDVRRIEDIRYLSYYKYEQQSQIINPANNSLQNTNNLDENHLWDTLSTALMALKSSEMNPQKICLINDMLENLSKYKKAEYTKKLNENQMQWEYENKYHKDSVVSHLECNTPVNKRVRFIQNVCCCPRSPILRNRGTDTCSCIEEEKPNVREQMLQKKKACDVFF